MSTEDFWLLGRNLRALVDGIAGTASSERSVAAAAEDASPFPDAGIDAFLSHFVFTLQLNGPKSNPINITLPVAIQTVARSKPFIYRGAGEAVEIPLPAGSSLSSKISESDFPQRPAPYFTPGKEVVWLQIINLDARGDTPLGPMRIILGETLKREYPDLFQPSLGVVQSLGRSGFPARLFFDPCAIVESKAGTFRAVHGVLAYGKITEFPPVGSAVQTTEIIPLHTVDTLRRKGSATAALALDSDASVLGLSHPIDAALRISGDEAFNTVEASITAAQ